MRIFLVVPEVCLCRHLFQLLYFSLSFINVKDTPVTVLYDGAADAGALFLLQTYFSFFTGIQWVSGSPPLLVSSVKNHFFS